MSEAGSSEAKVTLCDTDQLIIDCQNQYTLRARSGAQATTVLEVTVYCSKVRDQRGCLIATEHSL